MSQVSTLRLPDRYNYIACFLTLECNFRCGYCINAYSRKAIKRKMLTGKEWVRGLNRIVCPDDLPVTLQGGEPSLHPDFIWIIKHIKKGLNIDILTNLSFNVDKFIDNIDPLRLSREAPYPNIRVSYHPGQMDLDSTIKKVLKMQAAGFSIGVFSILHPRAKKALLEVKKRCLELGIDFRTKEFLGISRGKIYGNYFNPQAVYNKSRKKCLCRTSELILDPSGFIFRCHHDLYHDSGPIGNLLDKTLTIKYTFRSCSAVGDCNPCDLKIKTDRFQIPGHHAVDIKDIER